MAGVGLASIGAGCTALTHLNLTECLQLRDPDLRAFGWGCSEGVDKKFPDPARDRERALRKILGARARAEEALKRRLEAEGMDAEDAETLGVVVAEEPEELPERVGSLTTLILDGCFNIGNAGIRSAMKRLRGLTELSIAVRAPLPFQVVWMSTSLLCAYACV